MGLRPRGMPAKHLARDFGMTLKDFTTQVDVLVGQLADTEASMSREDRKREVCAAVWAAITASFEASALSAEERERLAPLVQEVLIPHWQQHCAKEPNMAAYLAERSSNYYLKGSNRKTHISTASSIVRLLLDEIGVSDQRRLTLTKTLVPLFAHRMLGDSYFVSDIKNRLGIQLSVLAAVATTIGIAQACEPALKLFKIT